jgi:hypothetical protein
VRSAVELSAPPPLTRFHQRLLAEELSARGGDGRARVARALCEARVDLNPRLTDDDFRPKRRSEA